MFLLAARSAALLCLLDKSIERIPEVTIPEDVALARMLASTVIRREGEIDFSLARFYEHKGNEKTRTLLRLGVAQLAYTRIPDRAAIHATVELAKEHKVSHKLVNAVLRQVQRNPLESDPRLNASPWFLEQLRDDKFLEAVLTEPQMDVTCRSSVDVPRLECGSSRFDKFPVHLDCWAQDPAAACAARVLLESVAPGTEVLDACAAPGGKTMQLIDGGLRVVAVDRSAKRLERLRENLDRLKMTATVLKGDITRQFLKEFKGILVDAPCTCTGTARRHPEVLRKSGYGELLETQQKLLEAAYDHLEPGGTLVYSTCSVLAPECEDQIEQITSTTSARRWPLAPPRGFHPDAATHKGDLRIMPWHLKDGACDGHYVARLVKPS